MKQLATVYFERNPIQKSNQADYRRKLKLCLPTLTQIDASLCRWYRYYWLLLVRVLSWFRGAISMIAMIYTCRILSRIRIINRLFVWNQFMRESMAWIKMIPIFQPTGNSMRPWAGGLKQYQSTKVAQITSSLWKILTKVATAGKPRKMNWSNLSAPPAIWTRCVTSLAQLCHPTKSEWHSKRTRLWWGTLLLLE